MMWNVMHGTYMHTADQFMYPCICKSTCTCILSLNAPPGYHVFVHVIATHSELYLADLLQVHVLVPLYTYYNLVPAPVKPRGHQSF